MVIEVPLTRGMVTLIDDEDAPVVLAQGRWWAQKCRDVYYARRDVRRGDGKKNALFVHSLLTGWPLVDHIDHDGLNNQRSNLRPATHAQNVRNGRMRNNNTSGYRGVNLQGQCTRWKAKIGLNGRQIYLGLYGTAEEAARAYDEAAIELHGEFASLNFPRTEYL